MYIRKAEMFEIRSDDSEIIHWHGTREELNILLDDDKWFEHETIVFARLSAIQCSPRTEVKEHNE